MESVSENTGVESFTGLRAILFGGLIAGTLDITAACLSGWIRGGRSPIWIFQSVAGGFYGAETFNGGYTTAAIGLATHFFIATTATAVFYLASRKLGFMVSQAILSGALYGVAVWLFMNLVVLPLVHWGSPITFTSVAIGVPIHIFCVGLPIALSIKKFSK